MPTLFFVPGFSATELCYDVNLRRVFWCDYAQVAINRPSTMQLDDEGVSPGGDNAVSLFPGLPLTAYYSTIRNVLERQLSTAAYTVRSFSWDWRKDIYTAGAVLAYRIGQLRGAELPVVLLGHSAGGIVCRAAWHALRSSGVRDRIRRVVTLASPHFGTYYPVATWAGITELVSQLVAIASITFGPFGARGAGIGGQWGANEVIVPALTWPALYQLLSMVGAPDQVDDPHRELLYDGGTWHGLPGPISQRHLSEVRSVRDVWLSSDDSRPPPHIMSVVAGQGFATPHALVNPAQLGYPAGIGSTDKGDSVVTTESAIGGFPGALVKTAKHSDIPLALATSGELADLVLEKRAPSDPVPDQVVDTRPVPVSLGGPPIPSTDLMPHRPPICTVRRCSC